MEVFELFKTFFNVDQEAYDLLRSEFTYPPYPCAIPESFMLQKASTYYLKCLTESELNYISYRNLQQLFEKSQNYRKTVQKNDREFVGRYLESLH